MEKFEDLKQEELNNVNGGTYISRGVVLYRCCDLYFAMPGFQAVIYSPSLERIGVGTLVKNELRQDSTGYANGTAYFEYDGNTYDFGTRPDNNYHVGPVD